MKADIEAMYVALMLGIRNLQDIAADSDQSDLTLDILKAADLLRDTATLLSKYIDVSQLSIFLGGQ